MDPLPSSMALCPLLFGLLAAALLSALPASDSAPRKPHDRAFVFTESRDRPIRRVDRDPARWADQQGKPAAFRGATRPGEFYVFQIGVLAHEELGPLGLTFGPLLGHRSTIAASAQRCLSLGGIGPDGRRFAKHLMVEPGKVQVLWVGVDVPADAAGAYTGVARLRLGPKASVPVRITLDISGAPVSEHGDRVARNLSRLRWLDSMVGSEPTLTKPYTPVRAADGGVQVLGRELMVGQDGLPARIVSRFSAGNTRVLESGRDVLARPMAFRVETQAGPVAWRTGRGPLIVVDALGARWTAQSRAPGLLADTSGRLDYTGSGEVRVRLTATRDVTLADIALDAAWREEAAPYSMGLNVPGGRRPQQVRWKWDTRRHQDCFWMGDVNAGLMLRFKDAAYVRPPVNIYYAFRPLKLPASWGTGGVDMGPAEGGAVPVRAYTGPRTLKKGEAVDFVFELYLTPFRTIETEEQWGTRFIHLGGMDPKAIDDAVATADPAHGPNVVNVHHASLYNPYINYPYNDDSFPALCDLVRRAHARGMKLRIYYTTREVTQNMPELFALHSLNGEVVLPGPGKDAKTLLHPNGPHPWLVENLGEDFIPAWVAQMGKPYNELDLSVITTPDSRWNNFYLQGLQWLVDKADIDGVYIDDTALDGRSLQRARRILDGRPGRIIDLHTWNHFNEWAGFANNLSIYMEILPYVDRLWMGEGFNANQAAWDFWLVEMSGLPFGVMSEMLDGTNPWRGMVFGETGRLPWSGDPRGMWKVWDDYGIRGTEMIPFTAPECPVRSGRDDVLATVYRRNGRSFVALGSWAQDEVEVTPRVDWKALGLDPLRARLYAPAIEGMQSEALWRPGEAIRVAPGRGWFLVADEG